MTTISTLLIYALQNNRGERELIIPSWEWECLGELLHQRFNATLMVHAPGEMHEARTGESLPLDAYLVEIEVPGEARTVASRVARLLNRWISKVGSRYLKRKVPHEQ